MSVLLVDVADGSTEMVLPGKEPSMKFKLLVVRGEPRGKCLSFPPGEFVIGRGSECHIRPNSDWISRQHCLLRITRTGALIRDLGSTNGTLVNGVRVVGERPLVDGDKVQLGQLVFEARLEESIMISKSMATALSESREEMGARPFDGVTPAPPNKREIQSLLSAQDGSITDEIPTISPPD